MMTPDPAPLAPPAGFIDEAAALGVVFDPGDVERLGLHLALLLEANTRFNLTAITDPAEAWRKHTLDSLTLLPLLGDLPAGARVADVGSGGGSPGLPLAITLPHLRFTLIESTGKKAAFLGDAVRALGLTNVEVVNDRAETVGQDRERHRERYDVVIARALGPLAVAAELTTPLARPGGRILLIKGGRAEEESEQSRPALHRLRAVCAGIIPTPTGRVVVLEKRGTTPNAYPRRPGEPKRAPLA